MSPDYNRIKEIKDFNSLIKYLKDELEWPIEKNNIENISFDYEPGELGISDEHAVKIESIKQIRPLVDNQPWGIFYIEFESKRLPVVILRRILSSLVPKQRKQNPDHPVWNLNDLLFISAQGDDKNRGISFIHFKDAVKGTPPLMIFSWDRRETHLEYIKNIMLEKLHWPKNTADQNSWQEQWSSAFIAEHREVIRTSQKLAEMMAKTARRVRERLLTVFKIELKNGPIHSLYERFKKLLIHDIRPESFADMYSQTVAYGLFSARCMNQDEFDEKDMVSMVPNTNPFLKQLFKECIKVGTSAKNCINFDELGLQEMIDMFKDTEINTILMDFGKQSGGHKEDPIIYFYELFMKEYDPEQKIKRGEFYTPDPVVSFIVRSVDYILKTEFDCPDGLADTSMMKVKENENPYGASPLAGEGRVRGEFPAEKEVSKVTILDPATGTGTFLKYTILQIKKNFDEKYYNSSPLVGEAGRGGAKAEKEIKEKWNEYVPKHLLPRLFGFELMMAPYSVAHTNLGLTLSQTGYDFKSEERLNVFLTNALEEPSSYSGDLITDYISEEGNIAGLIKRELPITVVIGNPPYSVSSVNKNLFIEKLMERYKTAVRDERNIQPLSDDYIKFIRFMHWVIEKAGVGIIGIISNNSFLDGVIHRGFREELQKTFNEIYILNLHGNINIKETCQDGSKDDNVFDIKQGVSISFFVKTGKLEQSAKLFYSSIQGDREFKYEFLYQNSIQNIKWEKLIVSAPNYWFKKKSTLGENEYLKYWSLIDIFDKYSIGVVTGDDDNKLSKEKKKGFADFNYRPFENNYINFSDNTLQRPRLPFMLQYEKQNIGLLSTRGCKSEFSNVLITKSANSKHVIGDAAYNFPLYIYIDSQNKQPNFTKQFKIYLKEKLAYSSNPENILHYIYSILHSDKYRLHYAEFLKSDYPRIPFPKEKNTFKKLSEIGQELIELHLMVSSKVNTFITPFTLRGSNKVNSGYPKYEKGKIFINKEQYFANVPEDVWEFCIGGYQVCSKWLKYRKGRTLSKEDISHYQKIIVSLNETIKLMKKIDEAIPKWPIE